MASTINYTVQRSKSKQTETQHYCIRHYNESTLPTRTKLANACVDNTCWKYSIIIIIIGMCDIAYWKNYKFYNFLLDVPAWLIESTNSIWTLKHIIPDYRYRSQVLGIPIFQQLVLKLNGATALQHNVATLCSSNLNYTLKFHALKFLIDFNVRIICTVYTTMKFCCLAWSKFSIRHFPHSFAG